MSRFIDLIETFDFTELDRQSYGKKIDGLVERFPKYDKYDHRDENYWVVENFRKAIGLPKYGRDDICRTVLPNKSIKTADDYVSMKFCTRGRHPIYGIYKRRDFDLVGVCVHGNIMYALDDCDLPPSSVPDLKVRHVHLGIHHSPLATRETLNHTKKCLCSAISTLSLGYTPEKKNEWCEAIVLLTGMTTQALRFPIMKDHVECGLGFKRAHSISSFNGRYVLPTSDLALLNRWNKLSKAIRRGEYPYVYSFYLDHGPFSTLALPEYSTRVKQIVLLINDRDKTKREKTRRRIARWNGPLDNCTRKREEESQRKKSMEREAAAKRIMEERDNNFSERMHGFWYGLVDTSEYEVASVNRVPGPAQIVRDNRFLVSATCHLARLKDVLQAQRTLASILPTIQKFWNVGTSTILENWGLNMDGPDSNFFLRSPRLNPSLGEATHRAIVDCTHPVFSAAICAKRCEVATSKRDLCFDHFGTSKMTIDSEKVKWNRGRRPFVLPGHERSLGAFGATYVCLLQVITTSCRMHAQHFNTKARYCGMSHLFWRTLQHKGSSGSIN